MSPVDRCTSSSHGQIRTARRGRRSCGKLRPDPGGSRREIRRAGVQRAPRVSSPIVETVLSYGLAIVAFGVMAAAVLKTLASNLKYIYTRPLLINSLRTNANHTEMLCKSSPETYFAAIGEAIKTAGMMRSNDPKVLPTATAPAYDPAGKGAVA